MKIAGVLAILLLCGFHSFGQSPEHNPQRLKVTFRETASDLLRKCDLAVRNANDEDLDSGQISQAAYCYGYVEGVVDQITTYTTESGAFSCVSSTVGGDQLVRVVAKYLTAHPERLNAPASFLVANAIREAFTCQGK